MDICKINTGYRKDSYTTMKQEPHFYCAPIKGVPVIETSKAKIKLDSRQKWGCIIKDYIYEVSRQNVTLSLSYDEFYEHFHEWKKR